MTGLSFILHWKLTAHTGLIVELTFIFRARLGRISLEFLHCKFELLVSGLVGGIRKLRRLQVTCLEGGGRRRAKDTVRVILAHILSLVQHVHQLVVLQVPAHIGLWHYDPHRWRPPVVHGSSNGECISALFSSYNAPARGVK